MLIQGNPVPQLYSQVIILTQYFIALYLYIRASQVGGDHDNLSYPTCPQRPPNN
jgi:hypothetical protein